jgi:hypothetical protein
MSTLHKNIGVDFCTQPQYPPLQYEGERALQIAAFSHSGAGLSRLSLRSTQISLSSVDLVDIPPVSFYC